MIFILIFFSIVEFKGHQLLEAAKSCDSTKLKKQITPEIINFQHPLTLESSLVCTASAAKNGTLIVIPDLASQPWLNKFM